MDQTGRVGGCPFLLPLHKLHYSQKIKLDENIILNEHYRYRFKKFGIKADVSSNSKLAEDFPEASSSACAF